MAFNVTFIVVDAPASYNAILGRSTLNPNRMIHLTYNQLLKFLTPHRIGVVRGYPPVARRCYVHLVRRHTLKKKKIVSIQMNEDLREEKVVPPSGGI